MDVKNISIIDFNYELPADKIALHPLAQRDASKLLVYKNGAIQETIFANIANHLPPKTLLVFNNTKVINARIKFAKTTGAVIEIFCLEPFGIITAYNTVMQSTQPVQWKCLVGGAAKWKDEMLEKEFIIDGRLVKLQAKKIATITEAFVIEFSWNNTAFTFADVITAAGNVPLPPYIKRNSEDEDTSRYQTIFAQHTGSVAAPTAGLHFTEKIFEKVAQKNIEKTFVTLHVGAGTFKPVKATTMAGHEMHSEYIDVDMNTIETLLKNIGKIAVVGTTSLRTIETLYWLGAKVCVDKTLQQLSLQQWEVYDASLLSHNINATDALTALLDWMKTNNKKTIFTQTQILIAPGYKFKLVNILVTNFHQPKSTLLLLVAAAIGNNWKKMYDYALENEFRFLSYGDGNLIFIPS